MPNSVAELTLSATITPSDALASQDINTIWDDPINLLSKPLGLDSLDSLDSQGRLDPLLDFLFNPEETSFVASGSLIEQSKAGSSIALAVPILDGSQSASGNIAPLVNPPFDFRLGLDFTSPVGVAPIGVSLSTASTR